ILVTGGAGFIGSHIADRLLTEGYQVVAVDNFELGRPENIVHLAKEPRFEFCHLDVLERPALEGLFNQHRFSAVFHMAANSDISRGGADTERDLRLTFLSTFEVLEGMRRHKVRQIVFASSSAVYGERKERLTEDA